MNHLFNFGFENNWNLSSLKPPLSSGEGVEDKEDAEKKIFDVHFQGRRQTFKYYFPIE